MSELPVWEKIGHSATYLPDYEYNIIPRCGLGLNLARGAIGYASVSEDVPMVLTSDKKPHQKKGLYQLHGR